MLIMSAAGLWWFLVEKHSAGPTPLAGDIMIWGLVAFVVLAIFTAAATITSATVLTTDAVKRRGLFRTKSMLRSDIGGYRIRRPGNSFPSMKLLPKRPELKSLTIGLYRPDADFEAWFDGVPDLDEEDRKRAEQSVLDDPQFGADREERKRTLARWRRVASISNGLGIVLFFWVFIWAEPYLLAIGVVAAAPVVALVLIRLSGGRLALYAADARPTLGGLMFSGLALPLRALLDIHPYHWNEGFVLVLFAGLVAVWVSWLCDRRIAKRSVVFGLYALAVLAFAWGAVMETDMLADRSRPQVFETHVVSKWVTTGKHTSYNLNLAPWGDRRTVAEGGCRSLDV